MSVVENRTTGQVARRTARGICRAIGAILLVATPSLLKAQEGGAKCPPPTRVEGTKDTYGTTVVADPYRWLEDQESKETQAWIDAQDKCTEAALSKLPGRDAIAKRLTELYRIDSYGMPEVRNGRYFFTKRLAGQDLNLLYMRQGSSGPDEVLIGREENWLRCT
jgi:protease II